MLTRALLGLSGGGAMGALYAVLGRCHHGVCAIEWNPVFPTVGGAALGLFVVFTSRWD